MDRYTNYDDLLKKWNDLGLDEISRIYKINAFNTFIKTLPVANVEEVKHGEWEAYETEESYGCDNEKIWYKCSVCGTDALGRCYEDEWYSYPLRTNRCPNCGAKMNRRSDI